MNEKFSISRTFDNIIKGLSMSFRRYPVAIAFAAVASVCGLILVNLDNASEDTERLLVSILMAMVLGALVSLVLRVVYENNPARMRIKVFSWIVFGCAAALYIAYLYGTMEGFELFEMLRFAALSLATVVLFMTAVFRRDTIYQEVYSTLTGWRLAITAAYTLIIWGGVSLILFAIERLLNVRIEEEAYMDTIIILLGFFSPVFFLSGIPEKGERLEPSGIYKFFRILVVYVIAPLLTAYTAVFYIYALRILFVWDWPDGMVGNMVLWYALIGTVTMYFLHGMDGESKWASFFGKWFPRIVILPIVLLFISLGIRINAYGITPNRYLLGVTGIWMLGCAVYQSIISYKVRNTRIITISLAVIAILSFLGPWSAINTGRISQTNRLEKLLVENNMLKDDGTIVSRTDLDEETKGEISDKLRYLEYSYDYKKVDFLPKGFSTEDMKQVLGFEYTYYYPDFPIKDMEDYIFINQDILSGVVPISGYDYIWNSESWNENPVETSMGEISFRLIRDERGGEIIVEIDQDEIFAKEIAEYIDEIVDQWEKRGSDISYDQLSFDEKAVGMDIRIIFTGLEIQPNENGSEVGWFSLYVLVDIK